MMSGQKTDSYLQYLAGIILISILFFPDFHISSLPAFQLMDFILPLVCLVLFIQRKSVQWLNYYTFLGAFGIYVLLTILINGRYASLKDYFEIYKFFKFLAVILFFTMIDGRLFLKQWVKPVFIGLVVVNLLHFFNVFNFNYILENFYDGGLNIEYFGKNSLGESAGKRMVGLIGNPNNNAILFSFFAIYFMPFYMEKSKIPWFVIAMTMVCMCQSRTTMVAIAAILAVLFILKLTEWKLREWLIFSGLIIGVYMAGWIFSSSGFQYAVYGNSMFNGAAVESQSAMGRLEVWKFLGKMILEKPVFGYGPNKDFFYDNEIYSENEYVLYAWRYGIIGLVLYLLIYLIPLKKFYFSMKSTCSKYLVLIVVLMMITAITNNPFTERNILILFAISLGIIFNLSNRKDPITN